MGKIRNFFRDVLKGLLVKEVYEPLAAGLGLVATSLGAWGYNRAWFLVHWKWFALGSVGLLLVFVLLAVFRRRKGIIYQLKIGRLIGLSRAFPVKEYRAGVTDKILDYERKAADAALVDAVRRSTEIKMQLASGFRHLGCDTHNGILYKAIRYPNKRKQKLQLQVMLMNYKSNKIELAGKKLTEEEYREGMKATLYMLADWKKKLRHVQIEVRTINYHPAWQMIFTEKELWLICSHKTSTGHSPVYCFDRTAEDKYGLTHGFLGLWQLFWEHADKVQLDKVPEPNWNLLQNKTHDDALDVNEEVGSKASGE